ncbi:MAG: caspase family protein [Saprospiraceae bacterium]
MKKLILGLLFLFPCILMAQKPALMVPKGHSLSITAVEFSPDGRFILTGGYEGTVKLWTKEGRLLHTIAKHKQGIGVARFSPDGQYIFTASSEQEAYLWTLDGRLVSTFKDDNYGFHAAAFAPDGQRILTTNLGLEAKIWNLQGRIVQTFNSDHSSYANAVAFSPNGKHILTASQDQTFKIWDQKGKLIKTIAAHDDYITAIAYSPKGEYILTSSADKTIKLWSEQGELIRTLSGHTEEVTNAVFSPKGDQILSSSNDKMARLWDIKGQVLQTFTTSDPTNCVAFSPDGQRILTGGLYSNTRLWKIDGTLLAALKGQLNLVQSVRFSPDGQRALIGTIEEVKLWDLKNQLVQDIKTSIELPASMTFSPDGQQLLIGADLDDGKIIFTDLQGNLLKSIKAHDYSIVSLAFAPGGQHFLSGSWDNTAKLWDQNGQLIATLTDEDGFATVAISPDGKTLLTGNSAGYAKLWDTKGNLQEANQNGIMQIRAVAFAPDGQSFLLGGVEDQGSLVLSDLNGYNIEVFSGHTDDVNAVAFSPDGQLILSASSDLTAKLWDRDGRLLKTLEGHTDRLTSAAFSPDGRYILTGSHDNTVKLWSTETGIELATLILIGEDDWIVTTPSSLFDASQNAMKLLYYVVAYEGDLEVIELDQLKGRYYEPGLLAKLLDFSDERIRPVEEFETVALYPKIAAEIKGSRLFIRLQARNGGIGGVSVFINGKEVVDAAEDGSKNNIPTSGEIQYDLSAFQNLLYQHPDSSNTISIRAYNNDGWLKSQSIELPYKAPQVNAKGRSSNQSKDDALNLLDPKMYVISIGTSNYTGTKLDLQYADQDATVMARVMQTVGNTLFTDAAGLEVYCFSTASADSTGLEDTPVQWQFSNKKNIEKTFQDLKTKAKAEDILVVYLSGHGVTYGNADQVQFHYLTQGIADDDLNDTGIRKAYTISSDELTKWINDIPALKQVLIIDACNSGKIVERLTGGTKALNSSQIRALDRMKDRTGMFILSGSASDKVSYEASEYGQGLLTYAIIQGMLGVAARKTAEGEYVDVMKLFQYARDEVPRLAASINGIQTPMLGFPTNGASFDLGLLNESVKASIPLSSKKPVFIRSIFLNEDTFDDDLDLVGHLQTALQKESEKGKNADLIYIDVNTYPQAYAVRGFYKKDNKNKIDLRVKLLQGTERIELQVPATDDPERLMKTLIRSIKKELKSREKK